MTRSIERRAWACASMSDRNRLAIVIGLLVLVFIASRADSVVEIVQINPQYAKAAKALIERHPTMVESDYRIPAEIKARQEYEREHGIAFPELVRGNPSRKEIALTFDDGPHPLFTPKLLDMLRQERVPATFFVVGKMVDRNPELVQREAAEGHEVANHTYHHLRLASIPPNMIEPELREGARAIARAVGAPTRLYRPPGGEYNDDVIGITKRLGYIMVLWTDDPGDFTRPGSTVIEQRTLRNIRNGSILLFHDGIQQTLDILPDVIAKLRKRGFKFVTCSQMASESGDITTGGPRVPIKHLPVK